ncbi:MAG: tyrosine-type recombinase/integrase [Clostridia bacterium]
MSVRELERNKRYKIEVVLGYNGKKKIRHTEVFHGGKKDATLRENEIKAQAKNHTFVKNNKKTVKDLLDEYMKYKKEVWTPKTYVSNIKRVDNIKKKIGHIHLQDLNVKILEDFYSYLRNETNYSDSSIKKHYILINSALNKAILWDYISYNVNQKIECPKVRTKETQCYSLEEVNKLLEVLQNEPIKYQSVIMLALDSGIRRGELTGLTWDDIDFNNSTINVNKTTQYTSGYGVYEKPTKSQTSDRKLYISETTLNILKKYRTEQLETKMKLGSKWGNSKRVFTTEDGFDMHPNTPSYIFQRIIKKYNLKKIKFHALRHTCISLMILGGIQTQVISRIAGHSSMQITDKIYSHFFDDEYKKASNVMSKILSQKAN